jgi:multiple sugar transport system substrate-binding protein
MAAVSLLAVVIAGCSTGAGSQANEASAIDPNTPITLKVAYFNDQIFNQTYGTLIRAQYPNVDFEVISTMGIAGEGDDPLQAFEELVAEQQPDLIIMNEAQYEMLAASGGLSDLESMMGQNGFDAGELTEGVVEQLRQLGGGKLYGLAPTFSTQALYYNKALFDQYGVPYPTDGMTWEEVLALAGRFPTEGSEETRVYGLAQSMFMSDPFELVKQIASSMALSHLNADASALTMDNDGWKAAFRMAAEAYKSSSANMPEAMQMEEGGKTTRAIRIGGDGDLFNSGRAAMIIDGPNLLNQRNFRPPGAEEQAAVDLGIVTMPVDSDHPDLTSSYDVSQIFGIGASSGQAEAAWDILAYVNGADFANIRAKTVTELQTRKGYETGKDGIDLSPFYKLKPNAVQEAKLLPKGFTQAFNTIANEELRAAVDGSKTIDEAFASLVSRSTEALTEASLSGEKESGGGIGGGKVSAVFIG